MTTARGFADRIAAHAPTSVQQVSRAVVEASGRPFADACRIEDRARRIVFASADAREAPCAFEEKRSPV